MKKYIYRNFLYFKQSKCFYFAAELHVFLFHGQPFSRAYFKQSKCPPFAALEHVVSSHRQHFSPAYLKQSKCPFPANIIVRFLL